jgi:hypothetical protein
MRCSHCNACPALDRQRWVNAAVCPDCAPGVFADGRCAGSTSSATIISKSCACSAIGRIQRRYLPTTRVQASLSGAAKTPHAQPWLQRSRHARQADRSRVASASVKRIEGQRLGERCRPGRSRGSPAQGLQVKSSLRARAAYQSGGLWVIDRINNGPIPNAPNRLVNHMERHQKPLPRLDRMPEAVFDRQFELRCAGGRCFPV